MHESFLVYRNFRHLKLALGLIVVSLVFYAWHPWHSSTEPPNGGTWLGYTLGTIGALLILWLTWFGVRKRKFSASSKLQGWLSAHVYLGASLIFVATLHTGFQFGWNVHTLAYVLMMTVIISGFYGIYAYARYPNLMTANRAGESLQGMLDEIAELDNEAIAVSDRISSKIHEIVLRSIERTQVGGTVKEQLSGSTRQVGALDNIERELEDMQTRLIQGDPGDDEDDSGKTMMVMARQLSRIAQWRPSQRSPAFTRFIDSQEEPCRARAQGCSVQGGYGRVVVFPCSFNVCAARCVADTHRVCVHLLVRTTCAA